MTAFTVEYSFGQRRIVSGHGSRGAGAAEPRSVVHFGERVRHGKYGFHLIRDMYALPNRRPSGRVPREWLTDEEWNALDWMYEDPEHTLYSDAYLERNRHHALENFDLNMAFFAQIPHEDFDRALKRMCRQNRLAQIFELRQLDELEGVYVMVLDDYRQAYIGKSGNMRRRILSH